MPTQTVTSNTVTYGSVCYFVGHVGGRQAKFIDTGEGTGYTLEEPLLCPITGQVLAESGHTDPSGNTGSLYCRNLEATDATLAWECFAGESLPDKAFLSAFSKWLADLTDDETKKAIVAAIDWS